MIKRIKSLLESFYTPPSRSQELVVSLRELAALYNAAIPIARGLDIIGSQTLDPRFAEAFKGCSRQVQTGKSIAGAMACYPKIFPELYVKLIQAGEQTGNLEAMLNVVAGHAEENRHLTMKLYAALNYPLFIFILCVAFLIIGPSFVFKGIFRFLQDLNVPLPLTTRMMIAFSTVMRTPLFLILLCGGCLSAVVAVKLLFRKRAWRGRLQRVILSLPMAGEIVYLAEVASFARTFAVIHDSAVPLLQGITIVKNSISLVALQDALDKVAVQVADGICLHDALAITGFFKPAFLQFLKAGEESGAIGRMLNNAAWINEQNVNYAVDVFSESVKPVVLFIIGIIVGFVVLSTMLPLMEVIKKL